MPGIWNGLIGMSLWRNGEVAVLFSQSCCCVDVVSVAVNGSGSGGEMVARRGIRLENTLGSASDSQWKIGRIYDNSQ